MRGSHILLFISALLAGGAVGYRFKQQMPLPTTRRILYYQDPMHPAYRSAKPGIAPDCGMDLVPVYANDSAAVSDAYPSVKIDGDRQRQFGIRTVAARLESGSTTLRLFARVEPDDTRIFKVDFGTDGYVRETHDDAPGSRVSKNQRLATIYSPEILTVAGGYLAANERTSTYGVTAKEAAASAAQGAASLGARADRLRNLGMSDAQIDEISKTRKLPEDAYIVSPVDGFILSRAIAPGMRVERHNELYTIADLSRVWVEAEAYDRQAQDVRVGQRVRIWIANSPNNIEGVVLAVLPEVDSTTHAVKVRVGVKNPGLRLRPGMYVTAEIPVAMPRALTVPVDAVIDSGTEQRVFVRQDDSHFVPRLVRTGAQLGDQVQILSGLQPGDAVVLSSTFLVDSEARLRGPDPTR